MKQYVINLLRNFTERIELEKVRKNCSGNKVVFEIPRRKTADEFLIKAGEYYQKTYG